MNEILHNHTCILDKRVKMAFVFWRDLVNTCQMSDFLSAASDRHKKLMIASLNYNFLEERVCVCVTHFCFKAIHWLGSIFIL